jgi:hypothetical protein
MDASQALRARPAIIYVLYFVYGQVPAHKAVCRALNSHLKGMWNLF